MNTTYQETRSILRLTIPIAAATILEGSVYFLNTWMMAKLGSDTLAAGALITNLFSTLAMIFWGIFSSSSSLFARYLSENNTRRVAKLFGASNLLSVVAGVLTGFILWNSHFLLNWTGQPQSTVQISTAYAHGLAFAEIPDLLTFSLFNFLQGADRAAATFWLSMLYVPLNIISNYVLVFGKFGLPALGAAGIGYGTCVAYIILFLAIVIYLLFSSLRQYCWRPFWLSISAAKELIFIGGPVGLTWGIGYLYLFFVSTLFGRISTDALAAYQIVSQWLSGFFVITLSLSKVLAIRIGMALGKKNRALILLATNATVGINIFYIVSLALILLVFPEILVSFDLDPNYAANHLVVIYANNFFKIAFFYLLFDTIRFLFTGALLGLKDTMFLLWTALLTWIVIGAPLVYTTAQFSAAHPQNIFAALIFCELLGTLILARRYYKQINQLNFN